MSDLTSIVDQLVPAMLVMFRFAGLMLFAPALSSSVVPARVRILLGFILGLAVFPTMMNDVQSEIGHEAGLWLIGSAVLLEITLGAVIGFLASLPLLAAQTGGLIMGQQMGLGFARFFNPGIEDEADVVGQFLFFLTLGGFLMIGGLDQIVLAVMHSFAHVPLGGFTPTMTLIDVLAGLLLAALELALRIAAPLLALIFLETVAMGFLAKTVPQLNILSLGFPIRILAGLFVIAIGLVVIDEVLLEGVDDMMDAIVIWVERE